MAEWETMDAYSVMWKAGEVNSQDHPEEGSCEEEISEGPRCGKTELTYGANELALRLILLYRTALRMGRTCGI